MRHDYDVKNKIIKSGGRELHVITDIRLSGRRIQHLLIEHAMTFPDVYSKIADGDADVYVFGMREGDFTGSQSGIRIEFFRADPGDAAGQHMSVAISNTLKNKNDKVPGL